MYQKCQLIFLIVAVCVLNVKAQKDTLFWFAAPSIAQGVGDYDRPVVFRISTYDFPATVRVSQPANPGFPMQTLSLQSQSTASLDLSPFFGAVENFPANTVLNKGFRIESTAPVSAYYEVIGGCKCNPDIFSLKGQNALGTEFYVPFQTSLPNTNNIFNPLPSASFDIVASENNTSVQITPTRALVGRPANVPFVITLQKGETYSGQALFQEAAQHPSGTHILSDKPVAVTMKDDLLEGFTIWGSTCKDLIGDQLVPVSRVGNQYVITKGKLNGNEFAYVVATEDNTSLFMDGLPVTVFNRGASFTLVLSPGSHYIEGTAPIYLLQMTGIGCETSAALLPSVECSGSSSVRFVRTTNEDFYLFISVRTGFEGNFLLNGNGQAIPAGGFQTVPGSNGAWQAGLFQLDPLFVPVGQPMEVVNTGDIFHLGILNGAPSVTGTRFGFFSDFGKLLKVDTLLSLCLADTINFRGQIITAPGIYTDTVQSENGCDTLFQVRVDTEGFILVDSTIRACQGDTITVGNQIFTKNAVIRDTLFSSEQCDTIHQYILFFLAPPVTVLDLSLCEGAFYPFKGKNYSAPFVLRDTLASYLGCDSILTYNLLPEPAAAPFLPPDTFICEGEVLNILTPFDSTIWNGQPGTGPYSIGEPGIYIAVGKTAAGCPAKDTLQVRACCDGKNLYVPNAFSPNDDGWNDYFRAFPGNEWCDQYLMQIYNRWGELLYQENTPSQGWDGAFRGRDMPGGIYVWVIEIFSEKIGKPEILKGDVLLVR